MSFVKASDINGLILAGGRSSRMGVDKSSIQYHGIPQRDYLYTILEKFCVKVFVSRGQNSNAEDTGRMITDAFPFDGPINGILSAFQSDNTVAWLTVPIDMPNVDEQLIQTLIRHRDTNKVATCFYDSDGNKPEPLLTIWEARARAALLAFVDHGNISPREFLMANPIHMVRVPSASSLLNINTPRQLAEFKQKN